MTAISGDLAYYSNGYYYTTDGTAIPESSLQMQGQEISYLSQQAPTDSFEISAANETCTDGKDDGKIGFFGAIGNIFKGAGKTLVNGIKGMFTDSSGNFSLGKTLLSIGTAALCIAVPAVGVAACAVGAVAGGVQVAKGAIAASQATTDAEAKEAWQNIGGGTFTAAASVAGAKAGLKGMTTGATKANGSSALNTLKGNGTKLSLKTAGEYGKAFVQDGFYSAKYNLSQARSSVATTAGNALESAKHPIKTAKNIGENVSKKVTSKTTETANKIDELTAIKKDIKMQIDNANAQGNTQQAEYFTNSYREITNEIKALKNSSGAATKTSQKTINLPEEMATTKLGQKQQAITNKFNSLSDSIKSLPKSARNALGKKGTEIWEALNKEQDASTLINKYGYDTILEVLKVVEGYALSNEAA